MPSSGLLLLLLLLLLCCTSKLQLGTPLLLGRPLLGHPLLLP
jgi:hypothetical protein